VGATSPISMCGQKLRRGTWTIKPEDAPRLHTVLYHMAETLRVLRLEPLPVHAQIPLTAKCTARVIEPMSRVPLSSIYWTWDALSPHIGIGVGLLSPSFTRITATRHLAYWPIHGQV